ncbi:glycosyltransferase family 4 protein [Enterovibrio baiacu]|uniref:glycosyltransferase family 4 protein n=1 Tax=Enterovibrio baiacu TaxID=2491023 RepID=UPI0013875102|nr:glycosyltransferase family 4 protein [Enterovibrio baiacu]
MNNAVNEIHHCTSPTSSEVLTALYIGHLLRSKGAFRVLELANEFRGENVVFKIAGEFGDESEKMDFLEEIERLELNNIELLGRVDGEKKATLFHMSDVLLLPSYSEAQPLTILEAFSCGLPVLATPVGGIVDILDEKTGRCVPFEDFGEALECILLKGRHYFSKDCKKKYKSSFTNKLFKDNCKEILR